MKTFACDFEGYYDSEISIRPMGSDKYIRTTDHYLVSIVGPGIEFCGHPNDAPWNEIDGQQWISHNRYYDDRVYQHLTRDVPNPVRPAVWNCTADLAAYLGSPRNLKEACQCLLGLKISKETRDSMKGKRWELMTPEFKEEVLKYAMDDSRYCLQLWEKHAHRWPETERKISRLTHEMGWQGVYINKEQAEKDIKHLAQVKWEAECRLPWGDYVDAKKGTKVPILSTQWLAYACRDAGIEPPTSLKVDNEDCVAWEEEHGKTHTWVADMRIWRRANALQKKIILMRDRVRDDGRMGYGLLYFGASTGRWTATEWGSQNQHKSETFGVNLRGLIIAPPGKKFIIFDLSNIEPRVLAWLTNNIPFLTECAKGISPYEVHARLSMDWKGGSLKKENPKRYALAKARLLSLGYSAGWEKFIQMIAMYNAGSCFDEPVTSDQESRFRERLKWMAERDKATDKDKQMVVTFDNMAPEQRRVWCNSWIQVTDFRESNPLITQLWKDLDQGARNSVGGDYKIELPSGRFLTYRRVSSHGGLTAEVVKDGQWKRIKIYGGLLTENLTQAVARDVFAEAKVRLWEAGYGVPVLSVHDEAVLEVDENVEIQPIVDIVRQVPAWIAGLPVDCEAIESDRYCK